MKVDGAAGVLGGNGPLTRVVSDVSAYERVGPPRRPSIPCPQCAGGRGEQRRPDRNSAETPLPLRDVRHALTPRSTRPPTINPDVGLPAQRSSFSGPMCFSVDARVETVKPAIMCDRGSSDRAGVGDVAPGLGDE